MLAKKCWGIIVQWMVERSFDGANGYILASSHEVADKIVLLFFFPQRLKRSGGRIDGFILLFRCKCNLWEKRGKKWIEFIYIWRVIHQRGILTVYAFWWSKWVGCHLWAPSKWRPKTNAHSRPTAENNFQTGDAWLAKCEVTHLPILSLSSVWLFLWNSSETLSWTCSPSPFAQAFQILVCRQLTFQRRFLTMLASEHQSVGTTCLLQ